MTGSPQVPTTYVLTSGADVARAVGRVAAWVVVVGGLAWWVGRLWWPGLVLLVVGVIWWLPAVRAAWTRIAVGPEGIRVSAPISWRRSLSTRAMTAFETRVVSWPVVHHLEVDADRELLRVVLRADAPLPPWERGRIVDLSDAESGPRVERVLPGVDWAALTDAVRAASPTTPVRTASPSRS